MWGVCLPGPQSTAGRSGEQFGPAQGLFQALPASPPRVLSPGQSRSYLELMTSQLQSSPMLPLVSLKDSIFYIVVVTPMFMHGRMCTKNIPPVVPPFVLVVPPCVAVVPPCVAVVPP